MQAIYIFTSGAISQGMRLTRYTDYSLRVLMHLATHPDRPASIGLIAKSYGISQNHLMKVVHDLGKEGFLVTTRGRGGGLRLARPPGEIIVGDVVRHTEDGFQLVDCDTCVIASACGLRIALAEAVAAFLRVLDGKTLADLVERRLDLTRLFAARERKPDATDYAICTVDVEKEATA